VEQDAAEQVGLVLAAQPRLEELLHVVVNSNTNRGSHAVSDSNSMKEGLLKISRYRPIREETKELLLRCAYRA